MTSRRNVWVCSLALATASAAWGGGDQWTGEEPAVATAGALQAGALPTHSSPIAITSNDRFVWSVNPDNNSVSVFNVANDQNNKVAEIQVGVEPWCVAITPDDAKVYVTNMVSGTVSVINAGTRQVVKTINVGVEPFGCVLNPEGTRLFVANQSSDDVSVINTSLDVVIRGIENVGPKPHGLAVTADGDKLYVTEFLAQTPGGDPRPRSRSEGADDGREGRVTVINARNFNVLGQIALNALPNTGFLSDGNTLDREPLTGAFDNVTGAFPNLLEGIVIRGNKAYIPNTCSSPNGPFRFNVNVQSCLSTINIAQDQEAFPTLNMNVGVPFEPVGVRLFNTNPFAIAFKRSQPEGFVALAATNRLLRVTLNAQGRPTINPPLAPGDPGNIIRIELKDPQEIGQPDPGDRIGGKNPRGIVINSVDTRAYVMDFISRDVAVVNIAPNNPANYRTIDRMQSASLPTGGVSAIVQRGKQLFNTAIGPAGNEDNSRRPAGRMSDFGWGTCYSCHPSGLTDGVTWMFTDGPRQAISMESTFTFGEAVIRNGAPKLPDSQQHVLNWSGVRDEVQDFERNIRAVSGGGGLIRGIPEGVLGLVDVPDLVPVANTGRNADLDAIATYLAKGVRAPIAPVESNTVNNGRDLFQIARCQNCHGGRNWTISILDYTPPPAESEIVDAQLVRFLCRVDTFNPNLFTNGVGNEIRANNTANVQARGDLGINVPSLISVFAGEPYLHSGAAPTLDAVLANVAHRRAGRADGVDTLTDPADRRAVVKFLKSIDRTTQPFLNVNPPANLCGPVS